MFGANMTFLRMIRLTKLFRAFRVLRVIRMLSEMRTMVAAIAGSLRSQVMCYAIMGFCIFFFCLIFSEGVTTYLARAERRGEDVDELVIMYFGTFSAIAISLFEACTGGSDWEQYYNTLHKHIGKMYAYLFIFYIAFFTIVVFNVITALFIDAAMRIASMDRDSIIFSQQRKESSEFTDMMKLCRGMDSDNSGTISWKEFKTHIRDKKVKAYLAAIGLDISDAQMFFETLAVTSGSGNVDIESFVQGSMRMKGLATALDMQCVMCQNKLMFKHHKRLSDAVHAVVGKVERLGKRLQAMDMLASLNPRPLSSNYGVTSESTTPGLPEPLDLDAIPLEVPLDIPPTDMKCDSA
eukprot:gnl/TRDRNA2_/TRDRNA2_165429_c1_seq1.p1 gnl/TRDRNA2_/TRDRNA2_165429_c1~~gnl/TRDRNA2_/TRDRNA2_165429_c1_seq1.p1  ORF type:complete len:351 (+),score=73.71 gnl/TRDRNA2_/TRDRNA2_165429_c1_seq1:213-1265(+)